MRRALLAALLALVSCTAALAQLTTTTAPTLAPRDGLVVVRGEVFSFLGGVLPPGTTLTRASTGTRINAAGLLVSEAADVARFTYDPVSLALQGLLVEPARTNLLAASEAFNDPAFVSLAVTITPNATAAPNGAMTADRITETGSGFHYVRQAVTPAAAQYAMSVFAKDAGLAVGELHFDQTAAVKLYTVFNLTAGTNTIQSALGSAAGIVQHANGWWRPWGVVTTTAAGLLQQVNTGNASHVANGVDGLYLWGMQLEAGSLPSSYIPTTAAGVTRAADVLSIALPNGTYNITIDRLSGSTSLPGTVITGGSFVVPTDVSPLRALLARRL